MKRINIGIESEILLEPGCLWEFEDTKKLRNIEGEMVEVYDVRVRKPSSVSKGVPTFGACIIAKRKSKKWRNHAKKSKMKRNYKNFKIEYEELGLSLSKNEFKNYLSVLNESYNSNKLSNVMKSEN